MEEGSLAAFVKIVKRMLGRDKIGREYEKNVLHKPGLQGGGSPPPFAQDFPPSPLSNDQFIIIVFSGRDSLSTGWLKSLFFFDFHTFS